MAVRKNLNYQRVTAIYEEIRYQPGIRPAAIAKRVGLRQDVVYKYLPCLDKIGALTYEDEKGGLYPCK